MIDSGVEQPWPREVLDAVAQFKQGDLVESPPFFYVAVPRHGVWSLTKVESDEPAEEELIELDPEQRPRFGLITTQTCDLKEQSPRPRQPWFTVVPVYQADSTRTNLRQVEQHQIGHLVLLTATDLPEGSWIADLRIELPIEKSWLVGREPIEAFADEDGYLKLAHRLARRRDRPALANVISNRVVSQLRSSFAAMRKGERSALLEQVQELRLAVNNTRLTPTSARLIVITYIEPSPSEVTSWFNEWWDHAQAECADEGLELVHNSYTTLMKLTAADYRSSIPLDFEYLSPEDSS